MPKSKSAYSTPTKVSKLETHIIVVWVDNESSVLSRVVGLFLEEDIILSLLQ